VVQLVGMTCVTAEAVEEEDMCVTEGSIVVGGENNILLLHYRSTLVDDARCSIADQGNVVYGSSRIEAGERGNYSRAILAETTVAQAT
jgi:hypothetical protein